MSASRPSFFVRFSLAFAAFFRTLFDADFAAGVRDLRLPAPEPEPEPVPLREADADAAMQLLAALQRKGRFLDFLGEDVSSFSDADIGAAARVVHDGAKLAVAELFDLVPIRSEEEGSEIELEAERSEERRVGDSHPSAARSPTPAGASPRPTCPSSPRATTPAWSRPRR